MFEIEMGLGGGGGGRMMATVHSVCEGISSVVLSFVVLLLPRQLRSV